MRNAFKGIKVTLKKFFNGFKPNTYHYYIGDDVQTRDDKLGRIMAMAGEPPNQQLSVELKDSKTISVYHSDDLYCLTAEAEKKSYGLDSDAYYGKPPCSHWMQEFKLKQGTIYPSAGRDQYKSHPDSLIPTVGCYLDSVWNHENILYSGYHSSFETLTDYYEIPKVFIKWPDMGVIDVDTLDDVVNWCKAQIIEGEKLQIGCIGAHGRTGTLLAAILIREGATAEEAIKKVRGEYCTKAIESKAQENLLTRYEETFLREENR